MPQNPIVAIYVPLLESRRIKRPRVGVRLTLDRVAKTLGTA